MDSDARQQHTGWFLLVAGNFVSRTIMYRKSKHGIEFAELCPTCCCVLKYGMCGDSQEDWFSLDVEEADLVPVVDYSVNTCSDES